MSPVSRLVLRAEGTDLRLDRPLFLDVAPVSIRRESLFPAAAGSSTGGGAYAAAVRAFLSDFERIDSLAGMFALLEKHLVTVPPYAGSDVSLFDVARTTAAIALCLHDEYAAGSWQELEQQIAGPDVATLPSPCLLVTGSLSGIQEFIFDIPSKRASKSLKGRSYYVQIVADVAVRHLLTKLNLKDASLLYNGGGNFVLLAPASVEERLTELRKEMSEALLPESLALPLAWTRVGIADFLDGNRFPGRWSEAYAQLERRKRRRFQELGMRAFEPFRQAPRDEEGTDDLFAKWTERLSPSSGYRIVTTPVESGRGEGRFPERLGLKVEFAQDRAADATVFNDTDFAGGFRDFRFAVKDLPRYTPELVRHLYPTRGEPDEVAQGRLIDFNHLAKLAEERTGTPKLGVLKMDVDNLGELFVRGFPEAERTVTRVASLSRALQWFFEGYMNVLLGEGTFDWLDAGDGIRPAPFAHHLYPVFSGGDDFFVLGAWDAVFEFARTVRKEFGEFVGHHPGVTLSAALQVIEPKESVSRFAARASDRLEDAKLSSPAKNRVSVFDQVLTWSEFDRAAELKHRLEVLVKQRGEARQIVQRVQQSVTGYERMQGAARRGVFRPEKIWRLAYFLGRNARKENLGEIRQIAELYERLLLDAVVRPAEAASPALFVVAGRWAELATRRIPAAAGG
jgi:CRISPR-associated protein Csm1